MPQTQNLFNYWLHNLYICRLAFQPWNDTPCGSTAVQPDATHSKAPLVPSAMCQEKGHSLTLKEVLLRPLCDRFTLHLTYLPTSYHALIGSWICTSLFQVNICTVSVTDFYLANLLSSLPASATLWSYECYGKKTCSSLALWSFLVFMTDYMCSFHRVTMEMHSLRHRKCRHLCLYKTDPVGDGTAGFRESKYCLFFSS